MENKQIHNPTRSELITDFVKSNPEYYIKEFQKIGSKPSFSFSFNLYAGILGPIWFGMRNIWKIFKRREFIQRLQTSFMVNS